MEKKNIYEAINAVMEDCGAVGKDSRNDQQRYKYRGIDAVMNALNPAMRKHGVFAVPEVLDRNREERTTAKGGLLIYSIINVKYTFYAPDGSSVYAVVTGEGMDSGDKSCNKAMSAAFKYACFQVFCIPTEEMIDSEKDSPEPEPKPEISKEAKDDLAKAVEWWNRMSDTDQKRWMKCFNITKIENKDVIGMWRYNNLKKQSK